MSGTRTISTTSRRGLSSSFFSFLRGKAPKKIHAILTETLSCFLPGRAKDLSAPLYCEYRLYQRDRNTGSYCQIVMIFEYFQHFFEKYSNMQFNQNPSSGSRAVSCGHMDRHDEASSHFSAILRTCLKDISTYKLRQKNQRTQRTPN